MSVESPTEVLVPGVPGNGDRRSRGLGVDIVLIQGIKRIDLIEKNVPCHPYTTIKPQTRRDRYKDSTRGIKNETRSTSQRGNDLGL